MAKKICTKRCYLTAHGSTLVEQGNKRGAQLFCTPGRLVEADALKGREGADKFFRDPEPQELVRKTTANVGMVTGSNSIKSGNVTLEKIAADKAAADKVKASAPKK